MQINRSDLRFIVAQLKHELKVDVCSLYLLSEDNTFLELAATDGLNQNSLGSTMSVNQGLTGRVARTKKPLPVKNPSEHPDYYHLKGSDEEKYLSYLGIPLVQEGQLLGVLTVQTIRSKLFFLSEIQQVYASGRRVIEKLVPSGVQDSFPKFSAIG